MSVSADFHNFVLEQLAQLRGVTSRRMFGGIGLYWDGLFFGLIDDDVLYLKVDDSNRGDYTARGMEAFHPFKDKPLYSMTYYQVPADVLEESELLVQWTRKSCAVALATRGVSTPRRKRTTSRPKTGSRARSARDRK
ncbi:MAG TPA: TfoX/Sxy family protein [Steroidobacteraceae bacterium]|nr:TfoX/Sxy family protein [Steroidobacteraceae bacterium]